MVVARTAPRPGKAEPGAAVREQVLDAVRQFPGIHVRALERRLGLPDRLAAYHLGQLEAEGIVQCVHEAGFARYFAAVGKPKWSAADVRFVCLLRRAAALRIVVLLASDEGSDGLGRDELGRRLGLARASVSYHLGLLDEAGLLASRLAGRQRLYTLADVPAIRGRLANFTPIPEDLEPFDELWNDLLG